jgi:hypothetical protein
MSFDLNQAVFDEQGTYLEEQAVRYEEVLMDQFAASPEGQAIKERGTELGWAGAMIHYAISYLGVTPPLMTPSDLEEVVFDLFPRKVITERGDKNYGHFGTFSSAPISCRKPGRCWHA